MHLLNRQGGMHGKVQGLVQVFGCGAIRVTGDSDTGVPRTGGEGRKARCACSQVPDDGLARMALHLHVDARPNL